MKGKLIQDKYRIVETLGRNTFSETFLAIDNRWYSNRRYIIKKLRPILGSSEAENRKRMLVQEANILQRLSGENRQIPRLYEYFVGGEDFYLVREWIAGLTLKQKVEQQGTFPSSEVEQFLENILSFLKYIHNNGIVYRQLKPSTIILSQKNWLSISRRDDLPIPIYFGGVKELAAKSNNSKQYSLASLKGIQVPEYIPPEQEAGKSVFASDLYSLGLTTIYLLTGKNPAEFPVDIHTKKPLWYQEIPELKVHLRRVIERAICPDMSDRFTSAEEMLKALKSPPISLAMPVVEEEQQPLRQFKQFKQLKFTSEAKVASILSLMSFGVLGLTFLILNTDSTQFAQDDADQFVKTFQADQLSTDTLTLDPKSQLKQPAPLPSNQSKIPSFPLGMTQQSLIEVLGKPTLMSEGYWPNSKALMYQDVIPEQIALGYLTDKDTTKVRQAEITFAGSVDLLTMKQQVQQLLQDNYSSEIDNYLNQIYFKTSNQHYFNIHDFQGVVQRNPEEHIYLGIWDQDFH
ncbi:MAG: serine/threonine protein kinase [Waterburya sp.]